jgi:hypothetical protein
MQPVAPPSARRAATSPFFSAGRSAGLRSRHGRVGGIGIDEAVKPLRGTGLGYEALKARRTLWPAGQPQLPWPTGASPRPRAVHLPRSHAIPSVLGTEAYPLHLIAQATTESMNSQILEPSRTGR